jgi:DNA (cytosine-5)-methyltransferase 1
VDTSNRFGIVQPFIVAWDHTSGGAGAGISSVDDPLSTVVTKARHGIAIPFLVELRGTNERQLEGSARSLDDPCGTITTSGAHHALVLPFLIKTANGMSRGNEDSRVRSLDDPMPTVCGNRGDVALIEPFLVSYYGTGGPRSLDDPLDTVTTKDRLGLVMPEIIINGDRYLLDIHFRMLQPHELGLANGFPKGYIFTGTKTDQVKQIGNAVPRRLARALVGAVISQNPDVSALVRAEEAHDLAMEVA